MGKIGKCCCVEGECCLCDPAWDFENWSVTVLGKTFSGTFSPSVKPDPFTPENGCQSRMGDDCIVDSPTILLDCVEESEWGSRSFVSMAASGFFANPLCRVACPQCFCLDLETGMQFDEACLKEGLVNWETESKGVTHSRAWQQEAYYGVAQILCCDTPVNSVRFSFDLYYHVSRFAAQSSQGFRRFRSVTYDCVYPPGQTVVTPTPVYGSWIQPVSVGSKPPCLPCDWPQSDFFGNCPTLDSNCSPCPDYFGCPDESVSYTMEWIAITCQFIGFVDEDGDNICPVVDVDDSVPPNRFIYYGSTTMNAYVGSNTQYCGDAIYGFGTCDIGPASAVIEHRFVSDCIPCDEIPCNVTLHRVTGPNPGEAITECVGGADADCSCGTVSAICKLIPASITMTLSPCT